MNVKAEAYQEWNQSAVVDKLITGMPEVVRALAEPLTKVDKITIVSTGGDKPECTRLRATSPRWRRRFLRSLKRSPGLQMSDLFSKVRPIGEKAQGGESGRRLTMALLERVATLIRANLNDLIDRAEDPEKMLKQMILDMQNQLIQVKTQVAIAIADQHILSKKLQENEQLTADWMRKAELAVDRQQEQLARPALEPVISYRQLSINFREQLQDQNLQVENLKSALQKLEQKLIEAQNRSEILASRYRRARTMSKAANARTALSEGAHAMTLDRVNNKIVREEATGLAQSEMAEGNLSQRLLEFETQDEVEQMLQAIKTRKALTA